MSFVLLAFTVFLLFLQPVSIFPELAFLSPIRNMTLISLIAFALSQEQSKISFYKCKVNRYFILFVVLQVISSMVVWVGSAKDSIITWMLYVILYYLIVKQCNTVQRIRTVILMIVLAICYLSYFSLLHFVLNYEPGMRAAGYGWYENSNDLSLILVCSMPLAILLAESASNLVSSSFWYLISGMFVFNVLFAGSRSGLLGISLVTGVGLYFSSKLTPMLKKIIAIVIIVAVIGGGLTVVMNRKDLQGLRGDDSSENRIVQWKAGIRMILKNPFLGVGPGEFGYEAEKYGGVKNLEPHNTLIQVFAEAGVLCGFFFLLFACQPLYQFLRRNRRASSASDIINQQSQKFIFVALCGFWCCALFSNRDRSYILVVLIALFVVLRDYLVASEDK